MVRTLEMGLDTFGDVTEDATGALKTAGQVIRDVIDEAVLADQLGVDFFGLGEHHRADFAVSAPEVVLAAIAATTGSSALSIATPEAGSACTNSDFVSAMASREPNSPRCAVPTLSTTAIAGRAMAASAAILPRCRADISSTR